VFLANQHTQFVVFRALTVLAVRSITIQHWYPSASAVTLDILFVICSTFLNRWSLILALRPPLIMLLHTESQKVSLFLQPLVITVIAYISSYCQD